MKKMRTSNKILNHLLFEERDCPYGVKEIMNKVYREIMKPVGIVVYSQRDPTHGEKNENQ
jgi:hypothetical protein